MRRSPLKRGTSQLKRTPLKSNGGSLKRTRLSPVSAKQRARVEARRDTVAEIVQRDGGRCRLLDMLVGHVCAGDPVTPHHLRKQSKTHDDSADNMVVLCASANEWVERFPALAHRMGLVIRDEDL